MPSRSKSAKLPIIGWREWVDLPELGISAIKAKVDSGARSSSLHAFNLKKFKRDGADWVRFEVHPEQKSRARSRTVEHEVLEYRSVRSSSGKASVRPVIITTVRLMEQTWRIDLTLAGRDEMGFRMLLGREAFRNRFLVDGGHSFYGGLPDGHDADADATLSE